MGLSIGRIEALLMIAALVTIVARRMRLPYTVGLVLAGAAVAALRLTSAPPLTRELVFSAFLPPLIFEAALHMRWYHLREQLSVVSLLATVGVLLTAAVVTLVMHLWVGWEFQPALLLGILISATDPVSVIATFKEAGVRGRLRTLLEAESLFNDGTVAVLFTTALAAVAGTAATPLGVGQTFVVSTLGGVMCGALAAGLLLFLAGRTTDHLVEITLSTVAAYGSFLIAESLGLSGVLATLTAGILVGNLGPLGPLSQRGHQSVESFWEYTAFAVNCLVFLLIGMTLAEGGLARLATPALLAIPAVLAGRALAVYGCCLCFARSEQRVPWRDQHVLFWGGLRGALALALALGLPHNFPARDTVIAAAFAVVAFSVIVQGLTVIPLLKRHAKPQPE